MFCRFAFFELIWPNDIFAEQKYHRLYRKTERGKEGEKESQFVCMQWENKEPRIAFDS